MKRLVYVLALVCASSLIFPVASTTAEAALANSDAAAKEELHLQFDYSAAEQLVAALRKDSITEAEAKELLKVRGIAATIKKMNVYFFPGNEYGWDASPDAFVRDVMRAVNQGTTSRGPFRLDSVRVRSPEILDMIEQLRSNENAYKTQLAQRLERYAPAGAPPDVKVYFVAGGSSDGFVLDDEHEPAFFVRLDKSGGEIEGILEDVAHELYHVLQKASGWRCPSYVAFVTDLKRQRPLQRLLATTLWEGTAALAVDSGELKGSTPYVKLLRDRYVRNRDPQQIQKNFQVYDATVQDLAKGEISWDAVEGRGFTSDSDERFYHVGLDMAQALYVAKGRSYFDEIFTRPPTTFFRDYITLSRESKGRLPRFSERTESLILNLPKTWKSDCGIGRMH